MAGSRRGSFEHRPDTGSLFKTRRRASDNSPHHDGKAVLVCPHCGESFARRMAAWIKQAASGKQEFLSLAFSEYIEPRTDTQPKEPDDDVWGQREAQKTGTEDDAPF